MKRLLDGVIFDAVNGLWLSGLYGIGAGAGLGFIAGAIAGTIVPIAGNLVGAVIGCLIGAIVGLPAGILGYGLGERKGWRIASCTSCLLVGSAIAYLLFSMSISRYSTPEDRLNNAAIAIFAVIVFTLVGLCLGDVIYNRLHARKNSLYVGWTELMSKHAVTELSAKNRAICLGIALVPVLMTYTQTVFLLLASVKR